MRELFASPFRRPVAQPRRKSRKSRLEIEPLEMREVPAILALTQLVTVAGTPPLRGNVAEVAGDATPSDGSGGERHLAGVQNIDRVTGAQISTDGNTLTLVGQTLPDLKVFLEYQSVGLAGNDLQTTEWFDYGLYLHYDGARKQDMPASDTESWTATFSLDNDSNSSDQVNLKKGTTYYLSLSDDLPDGTTQNGQISYWVLQIPATVEGGQILYVPSIPASENSNEPAGYVRSDLPLSSANTSENPRGLPKNQPESTSRGPTLETAQLGTDGSSLSFGGSSAPHAAIRISVSTISPDGIIGRGGLPHSTPDADDQGSWTCQLLSTVTPGTNYLLRVRDDSSGDTSYWVVTVPEDATPGQSITFSRTTSRGNSIDPAGSFAPDAPRSPTPASSTRGPAQHEVAAPLLTLVQVDFTNSLTYPSVTLTGTSIPNANVEMTIAVVDLVGTFNYESRLLIERQTSATADAIGNWTININLPSDVTILFGLRVSGSHYTSYWTVDTNGSSLGNLTDNAFNHVYLQQNKIVYDEPAPAVNPNASAASTNVPGSQFDDGNAFFMFGQLIPLTELTKAYSMGSGLRGVGETILKAGNRNEAEESFYERVLGFRSNIDRSRLDHFWATMFVKEPDLPSQDPATF